MELRNRIGRGFDLVAPFYDSVLKFVFGKSIHKLEAEFIAQLQAKPNCLVIGGGSGRILEPFIKHEKATNYFYADFSDEMIAKTKRRFSNYETLPSISYANDWRTFDQTSFDFIVLPFILDCYGEAKIQSLVQELSSKLSPQGEIIFVDFNLETEYGFRKSWWKVQFIHLLYFFFNLISAVDTKRLAPFNQIFFELNFCACNRVLIHDGWIQATSFRKK